MRINAGVLSGERFLLEIHKSGKLKYFIVSRAQFRKNAGVRDIRVIDMLVVQVRPATLPLGFSNSLCIAGSARPEGGGGALEADHSHHGQVVPRGQQGGETERLHLQVFVRSGVELRPAS